MANGVNLWTLAVLAAVLVVIALLAPLVRREDGSPSEITRARLAAVVAASLVPGFIWGDVRVFAVCAALNLTLGRREFVPFSKFAMFSTLPERQMVIFLEDEGGEMVPADSISLLFNQELNKIFRHARQSCRVKNPTWSHAQCDEVGGYFLNAAIIRSAAAKGLAPPDGVRIMMANLQVGDNGPESAVRLLRKVSLDE
jgi:hypothetical protein